MCRSSRSCTMLPSNYFLFRKLEGELGPDGELVRLSAVTAECGTCGKVSRLSLSDGLTAENGTGTMTCPGCGNQEVVSRMRVEKHMRTLAGTSAVSKPRR